VRIYGQSPHKRIASASTTTSDPTRCSTPSNRAQTRTISGLESGKRVETGAQQFAFSDSALGDLEFASTLVEFPIPRLSAGLECLVAL